jgi:hypothetical protein
VVYYAPFGDGGQISEECAAIRVVTVRSLDESENGVTRGIEEQVAGKVEVSPPESPDDGGQARADERF